MIPNSPKEKVITLRLDEKWATALDLMAEKQHKNKSQVIREGLRYYYFITYENPHRLNPNSIMSQNVLHFLFNSCPPEKMKELAKIAYLDGIQDPDHFEYLNREFMGNLSKSPESLIKIFTEYVFSKEGQRWFEQVQYQIEKEEIILTGTHLMGRNFFEYVKDLLIFYFSDYQYVLTSEKHEEIRQYLKDQNQQEENRVLYSLMLKFSPLLKNSEKK
jgi:hypothetical protein